MREMKCRCCGKSFINTMDNAPIHLECMVKHWFKHARGVNASRCKEFDNLIRE